ncbi:hypothetical protein N7532_003474 [Penicillium argentinense]|uniref:Uncharacterized protein n=1 Tax=Penicillium argentinense TaxID=1131581 RepID=A0A9W9KDX4_9EURO|nr:uncharacterized protein N7532_003474 [Penicillium argentinense]KAJ5102945.1 hypothetical protein N7532_003474 [Penicillium argentinense]
MGLGPRGDARLLVLRVSYRSRATYQFREWRGKYRRDERGQRGRVFLRCATCIDHIFMWGEMKGYFGHSEYHSTFARDSTLYTNVVEDVVRVVAREPTGNSPRSSSDQIMSKPTLTSGLANGQTRGSDPRPQTLARPIPLPLQNWGAALCEIRVPIFSSAAQPIGSHARISELHR